MPSFAPRPPSPGVAAALALVVLASLARPARGLAGFPDAVDITVPCQFDYECNHGVCRNGTGGNGQNCDCLGGWATVNTTAPCDAHAHSYQELMLVTYLGLGAFGVEAFQLGWVRWGVAIVVLFLVSLLLCARGRYLEAVRKSGLATYDYGSQLLGDGGDDNNDLRAQEDLVTCCGCIFWVAYALVTLAVAVVATVHCVDTRGVKCA